MGDSVKIREARQREKQAILRLIDHDEHNLQLFHSTIRKLSLAELKNLHTAIAHEVSRARVEGERVMQRHLNREHFSGRDQEVLED